MSIRGVRRGIVSDATYDGVIRLKPNGLDVAE